MLIPLVERDLDRTISFGTTLLGSPIPSGRLPSDASTSASPVSSMERLRMPAVFQTESHCSIRKSAATSHELPRETGAREVPAISHAHTNPTTQYCCSTHSDCNTERTRSTLQLRHSTFRNRLGGMASRPTMSSRFG